MPLLVPGCYMTQNSWWRIGALCSSSLLLVLSQLGCSNGGGHSDSHAQSILLAVSFPDPQGLRDEPETTPPDDAPLVQILALQFSAPPDPEQVHRVTFPIVDAEGTPAEGEYRVEGDRVLFIPRLPLRPVGLDEDGGVDLGGVGLSPGSTYALRLVPSSWPDFLLGIDPELLARFRDPSSAEGILVSFRTTEDPEKYYRGLPSAEPRRIAVEPADGSSDVSPWLYTDPEVRFAPRQPFRLRFDTPLHPDPSELAFQLIDLDDTQSSPDGLSLGVDVSLVENTYDFAVVEVRPAGVLPFGNLLSLEVPRPLRSLGSDAVERRGHDVAATFSVAGADDDVRDHLLESFDGEERRSRERGELEVGVPEAEWSDPAAGVLRARFAFRGMGELGRLIPLPPGGNDTVTLVLDTAEQVFPLFDGSTPDAEPGTVILGGVFPFTDIEIPQGVIVEPRGPNPLVLTATGSVRIAGEIRAVGLDGNGDKAFDSAVASIPGGAPGSGGGRGGEGHPIHFIGVPSYLTLVSPPTGGHGFDPLRGTRTGGRGGECGTLDREDENGDFTTDAEINCIESAGAHANGYKPPGGGGGSYLHVGGVPTSKGKGNVLADGQGGYIVRAKSDYGSKFNKLLGGEGGDPIFINTDPEDDFFGTRGELGRLVGGQGGGSGASALDSYYCGVWCLRDADSTNDAVCQFEFGDPESYADSVGDSRGGGGGGGGGAVQIDALGPVEFTGRGTIRVYGGKGLAGEQLACGTWSGAGGGGAGGAVVLRSATRIHVSSKAWIDVSGGRRGIASTSTKLVGNGCKQMDPDGPGSGGDGSIGLIQLQVPVGEVAQVDDPTRLTEGAWTDPDNTLNPAEFGPISAALSEWYDLGRSIARPPAGERPRFVIDGLDAQGFVITTWSGEVLAGSDVECDYLGIADPLRPGQWIDPPRPDFIPPGTSIQVAFQGASAIAPGSKEVDPGSLTAWGSAPSVADGLQFLRWRIQFDLASVPGSMAGPETPRPAVQSIRIRATY